MRVSTGYGRPLSQAKKQNWLQGLTVIGYDAGSRREITPVAINEGEALFEGTLYRADVRLEELRADTGWGI